MFLTFIKFSDIYKLNTHDVLFFLVSSFSILFLFSRNLKDSIFHGSVYLLVNLRLSWLVI